MTRDLESRFQVPFLLCVPSDALKAYLVPSPTLRLQMMVKQTALASLMRALRAGPLMVQMVPLKCRAGENECRPVLPFEQALTFEVRRCGECCYQPFSLALMHCSGRLRLLRGLIWKIRVRDRFLLQCRFQLNIDASQSYDPLSRDMGWNLAG